jgi:phosphoribosylformylglycinamidine cyclo-ligase
MIKGMAISPAAGLPTILPRILPDGCAATIDAGSWDVPPIFTLLRSRGEIGTTEMFRAFNMGIGLITVCAAADRSELLRRLAGAGEPDAAVIGTVTSGSRTVQYR